MTAAKVEYLDRALRVARAERDEAKARIEALEKALTIIRDGEAFLGTGDCLTASEIAAEALRQETTK